MALVDFDEKLGVHVVSGRIGEIVNQTQTKMNESEIPFLGKADLKQYMSEIKFDNNEDIAGFVGDVPIDWVGDRVRVLRKDFEFGSEVFGRLKISNLDKKDSVGIVYWVTDAQNQGFFTRDLNDFKKNDYVDICKKIKDSQGEIDKANSRYGVGKIKSLDDLIGTTKVSGKVKKVENYTTSFGPEHTRTLGMCEIKQNDAQIELELDDGSIETVGYVGYVPEDWVGSQINYKRKNFKFQGELYGRIGMENPEFGDELGVGYLVDTNDKQRYFTNTLSEYKKKLRLNRNHVGTYELHQIGGNDTIDSDLVYQMENNILPMLHGESPKDESAYSNVSFKNSSCLKESRFGGLVNKIKSFFD